MYLGALLLVSVITAFSTYNILEFGKIQSSHSATTVKRDLSIHCPKSVPSISFRPENQSQSGSPPPKPQKKLLDSLKSKINIVIIIPYRDRAVHYKKIMDHLPSIQRDNWNLHTILVEQDDNEHFKRAWLLNVGITEASKRYPTSSCIVTHDVDMIADSKVDYSWCEKPTQICSELSCFKNSVPYKNSAGGVVQATLDDWKKINGFTNTAIGWGGEDDDLYHRFRMANLLTHGTLRRPQKGMGKCHCMNDEHHTKRVQHGKGYRDIVSKIHRMQKNSEEWKHDGLNSIKYQITSESVDKYKTLHLKVRSQNRKRWLVFTSAGDQSNVKQWYRQNKDFDIMVVYYGNTQFSFKNIVDVYEERKDGKFANLQYFLQKISKDYEAIAVFDDDIEIKSESISQLFKFREKYDVGIVSPTFKPYHRSYASLVPVDGSTIRYVDFVEMNTPLFRRDILDGFMKEFDPIIKGWGADIWFSHFCNKQDSCDIAVADKIHAHNPLVRKNGKREIESLQSEQERSSTWKKYAKSHNIPDTIGHALVKGFSLKKTEKASYKTTLVLMGYSSKRIPNYEKIFSTYKDMDNVLEKIIFIWNNPSEAPPKMPQGKVHIQYWKASKNSMVNRYRILDYVTTESVLTVDDDVLLSSKLIQNMIQSFNNDKTNLVGLDPRSFTNDGKYSFDKSEKNKLVIGKTMMWNIKYASIFLNDKELTRFSEANPCEDIAMNFLIRHLTKKEPIIVEMTKTAFRKNLKEADGLSINPKTNWIEERNNCVTYMMKRFSFQFLGSEMCRPPYYGKGCLEISERQCSSTSDECFYNSIYGVGQVSCARWFGAQKTEQVTWDTRDTDVDRNTAHAKSFGFYKTLPKHLGHVVELGAGPFTQSKTILQDHTADSITLVEPMAIHYMNSVKQCYYKNGKFGLLPTTILSIPAEKVPKEKTFDTVVMINVIEHVFDAFAILKRAIDLVKPGGFFVWHERLWDTYKGKASSLEDREFKLHPIRLKKFIADQIIRLFETKYITYDTDELRRLKNEGVYFIGKRNNVELKSALPQQLQCVKDPPTKATIVIYDLGMLQHFFDSNDVSDIIYVVESPGSRLTLEKYKSKLKVVTSDREYVSECLIYNGDLKPGNIYCVREQSEIFQLLSSLDNQISKYATEKQIYGNVFSGSAKDQVESYIKHIQEFSEKNDVNTICEIGFAGGHSATTILYATKTTAQYIGFDMWDRDFYENAALSWVKEHFPSRSIRIIKGDSTKTVPNTEPLKCDIIHVDGAHHAHYPKTDYINMQRHASVNNLLLIDDCTDSWKAVMEGVNYATEKHIFKEKPKQFIPKSWSHRGKKKGWCIGEYNKYKN